MAVQDMLHQFFFDQTSSINLRFPNKIMVIYFTQNMRLEQQMTEPPGKTIWEETDASKLISGKLWRRLHSCPRNTQPMFRDLLASPIERKVYNLRNFARKDSLFTHLWVLSSLVRLHIHVSKISRFL